VFVASPGNSCRTTHQLCDHKNDQRSHRKGNKQLDKREGVAGTPGIYNRKPFHNHRLTAMNVSTDPDGTPVVRITCAGQLTITFAIDVVAVGGNRYVMVALNTAPPGAGGLVPELAVPFCVPSTLKKSVSGVATAAQ